MKNPGAFENGETDRMSVVTQDHAFFRFHWKDHAPQHVNDAINKNNFYCLRRKNTLGDQLCQIRGAVFNQKSPMLYLWEKRIINQYKIIVCVFYSILSLKLNITY